MPLERFVGGPASPPAAISRIWSIIGVTCGRYRCREVGEEERARADGARGAAHHLRRRVAVRDRVALVAAEAAGVAPPRQVRVRRLVAEEVGAVGDRRRQRAVGAVARTTTFRPFLASPSTSEPTRAWPSGNTRRSDGSSAATRLRSERGSRTPHSARIASAFRMTCGMTSSGWRRALACLTRRPRSRRRARCGGGAPP